MTRQEPDYANWINSDLVDAVAGGDVPRPQDDFHAAINHDWLSTAQMKPGEPSMSAFREQMEEVEQQVKRILADENPQSHVGKLVHRLYTALLDMDARNALGMAPVLGRLERLQRVSTLGELTAFLCDGGWRLTTSLHANEVFADKRDSLNNVVYLGPDSFSLVDANEYRERTAQGDRTKAANDAYQTALLKKVGFDEDAAAGLVEKAFAVESLIATACLGADAPGRDDFEEITYNPLTREELEELCITYPLPSLLDAMEVGSSRKFVLEEPDWLARMNEVYIPENLEGLKALLLVRMLMDAAPFLDQDCSELTEQWRAARLGSQGSRPLEKKAYDLTSALLGMEIGLLYTERYVTDGTVADVEHLIAQVIDTYRARLDETDWLSRETRDKAVEKLDAMTVRVARPKSWPPFEQLDFTDDADLLELTLAIRDFRHACRVEKVNREVDREEWLMSPQQVNAYYLPTDNSINILAGILGGVFYSPDAPIEERMGGIGMVIGHEITHAFDKSGSKYDKHGNLGESWWTDGDRAAFKERTDAVARYWDGIEVLPGKTMDGKLTSGENTADLGGLMCMAAIGHTIPGFDWAAFFAAYARNWRTVESPLLAEFLLTNDVHAPGHLRTNAAVQQLPEFHEAYGVRPGDGMYLPPEMRLKVW
jgi:putative endopeptidase